MINIDNVAKNIIESNAIAFGTIDKEGNPHQAVVAYVKVISNNQILITDNYLGTTIDNVKRNPNIALAVWKRNWEEDCVGYSIDGIAKYFSNGKWMDKVKKIPENKGLPMKGVLLVTIKKLKRIS